MSAEAGDPIWVVWGTHAEPVVYESHVEGGRVVGWPERVDGIIRTTRAHRVGKNGLTLCGLRISSVNWKADYNDRKCDRCRRLSGAMGLFL